MKKSEFKEYLKTEILQMSEATKEEVDTQKELNAELEKTKELTSTMEGKMKKSEFKEYLKNEILAELSNIDPGTEPKSFLRKKPSYVQLEAGGNIDPGVEPKSFLKKKPDHIQLEEEEEVDVDIDVTDDVEVDDEVSIEATPEEATLVGMTDELVAIAKRAKDAGFIELANQILNSAKFSSKTQFDAITPEV
jgi:hypothetical protein